MKIILLKGVGGVGQQGEVKEISDGYALNYLIPHGLAQQATPERIKEHEAAVRKTSETREREQHALIANIQALEGARVELSARATEKGGLFKSIGATDIQKAVREQKNIQLPAETISLAKPIKEIGEHPVALKAPGAGARLAVIVKKSD